MDVRALEETLAKLVKHMRDEAEARAAILERRIESLERQMAIEERLARLERARRDRRRAGFDPARILAQRQSPMTNEEFIDAKLAEGIELLNQIVILRTQEMVLTAGDMLDRPLVRQVFDAEHAKMLAWREETVALIESTLLGAVNRLN